MTGIIAYGVTDDMDDREAINALLQRYAWSDNLGYAADTVHASNYRRLLQDYPTVVESIYRYFTTFLTLKADVEVTDYDGTRPPHTDNEYESLADAILHIANDYPAYDDEDVSRLKDERTLETIREALTYQEDERNLDPHDILDALYEVGALMDEEQDGSITILTEDWDEAIDLVTHRASK